MLQALLIKTNTSNKTANRIYNTINKRFKSANINVETRSRRITQDDISRDILSKDIFIFLITPELVTDSEWISVFSLTVSKILSDVHKLLIPLTVDQSLTESFFKSMNIAEWLPLETDPKEYYQDIDWMVERIQKFAQEQGLDMSSELPPMDYSSALSKGIISYWFLKINETNWKPAEFEKGKRYFFDANHHEGKPQSDYADFKKLKTGDQIFAFAMPITNQAVALFRVTRALYTNNNKAELIDLEVQALIIPPIGLDALQGLPFYDRLNYEANEKLYPVDSNVAAGLLAGHQLAERKGADPSFQNQTSTLTLLSTDAPLEDAEDDLGIMADVYAIAGVIAYKDVPPPLAIGLFGNWGSGKSFFMQKIETRIGELAGTDPDFYCEGIVPVRFNSWHYSDANLWASLSSRIFDVLSEYGKARNPGQLESLFSQLHSTNEQAELAKQKSDQAASAIKTLTDKLAVNETLIKKKVDSLEGVKLIDIATKVLENQKVKKDIEEIREKADFVKWEDLDDVRAEAEKIKGAGGKVWAVLRQAYGFTKGKIWKAVLVFGAVFSIVWFLKTHVTSLKDASETVKGWIQWGSTLLAQLLWFIGPAIKAVDKVSAKLGSLGETIKDIQKEEREKLEGQLKGLKAEIAAAEAEQQALKNQQEQLEVKKALIEAEIADIRSGKKVISFIEARVTDERYVKSLGMISWVRKDFEMLESLLKQQRNAAASADTVGNFRIDRIVLYIDDLDRCKEKTVVEVLEAIHLLLAIPLFVVIVGVDPQWMETSLTNQLGGLIPMENPEAITPLKYLEKIFQIPFRLKSVNDKGFRELVGSQFVRPAKAPAPPTPPTPTPGPTPGPKPVVPITPAQISVNNSTDPDLLIISPEEIAFMQELAALIPDSPRTIKRYVNIYRIIRSHSDLRFGPQNRLAHYQAVMILLTVLTGIPLKTKTFFEAVEASAPDTTFAQFLSSSVLAADFSDFVKDLKASAAMAQAEAIPMSCFQLNTLLICRFSFYYK